MAEKAYYVDRIGRTVTKLLVFAENAKEAREKADAGEFHEAIDSITENRGTSRAVRAPGEDREASP